jgi:hypothetical protein
MANHQLSFAEIGTLYNTISNELEGGVTQNNQNLLVDQVSTVQQQLQGLIDSGALNNLDSASIVHAQNIADQMNFLKTEIGAFGTNTYVPKFINDVIRDVQDIVAGDSALSALAHQGNHSGFQQVSYLLTSPTPFPDSGAQTATLLQFVADSNALADRAVSLEGADPNSAEVKTLIADIHNFSVAADAYSTAQGGLFSARFNNEFTLNGVQGTASRELIQGLVNQDKNLIDGAAAVLKANAMDVRGNMLANGDTFTPTPNGGIPASIDTVHDSGVVFNDAMTKLIGGVYTGNQTSILNDLNATKIGLQNAINDQALSGQTLNHVKQVVALLDQESALVSSVDVQAPTQANSVNGQINQVQAKILSIVNHDATLASLATGADGSVGFAALPPGAHTHQHVLSAALSDIVSKLSTLNPVTGNAAQSPASQPADTGQSQSGPIPNTNAHALVTTASDSFKFDFAAASHGQTQVQAATAVGTDVHDARPDHSSVAAIAADVHPIAVDDSAASQQHHLGAMDKVGDLHHLAMG